MEDCLLNIAPFLEHRDCLALEVVYSKFRKRLVSTIFHIWLQQKVFIPNGYQLTYPNGPFYEVKLVQGREIFPERVPENCKMIQICHLKPEKFWIHSLYLVRGISAELSAFIWDGDIWILTSKSSFAPWFQEVSAMFYKLDCTKRKTFEFMPQKVELLTEKRPLSSFPMAVQESLMFYLSLDKLGLKD